MLAPTSPNETAVGVGRTSGWSAAATSTSPAPARVVGEATPPTETGRAVTLSAAFTWSGVHSGCRWSRSATAPETWGAAMLVPDDVAHPSGSAERIDVPGATKSGLSRSETGVGPEEEKPAMPGAVPDVLAPTVIARVELPGDDSEPAPEVVEVVPRCDDRDDAGRRGGVERERDDVARRLDLRLADREVDDVHAVGHGSLDRGDDLRGVAVEPDVRRRSGP